MTSQAGRANPKPGFPAPEGRGGRNGRGGETAQPRVCSAAFA